MFLLRLAKLPQQAQCPHGIEYPPSLTRSFVVRQCSIVTLCNCVSSFVYVIMASFSRLFPSLKDEADLEMILAKHHNFLLMRGCEGLSLFFHVETNAIISFVMLRGNSLPYSMI